MLSLFSQHFPGPPPTFLPIQFYVLSLPHSKMPRNKSKRHKKQQQKNKNTKLKIQNKKAKEL